MQKSGTCPSHIPAASTLPIVFAASICAGAALRRNVSRRDPAEFCGISTYQTMCQIWHMVW